jgi:hypothetical protein
MTKRIILQNNGIVQENTFLFSFCWNFQATWTIKDTFLELNVFVLLDTFWHGTTGRIKQALEKKMMSCELCKNLIDANP